MTEREMEQSLIDIISDNDDMFEEQLQRVHSFEEDGILTYNNGVVLRFENGDEFQLIIVKSK